MADSEEQNFPRGILKKKATENVSVALKDTKVKLKEKHQDDLFKSTAVRGKKRRIKDDKKSDDGGKKKRKKTDSSIKVGLVKTVPTLSYKNLREGMLLLGAVKEIHEYELIISLPHGLTGYVAITDISDVYNRLLQRFTDGDNEDLVKEDLPSLMDYFNIGQYVSCAVKELNTAVKGVRRTQLTLLSRVVNQTYTPSVLKYGQVLSGVVKSQEDHGYMIDLGITGVQAFLNHRYAKVYIDMKNNGQSLLVGQPVECCIKEVMSNGRSVTLTINPNKITKTVANKKKYPYLHMVVPGTRVKATVTEVHEDLLKVDFLEYSGFINHFHLPHFSTKCSHYKKGQEVTACILYNNASTKTVGLSLQTSLCEKLEKSSLHHNLRIGKICKKAVIKKIDGNHGILLQLKIVQSSEVYVLHTQVSDKTIEGSLKEHFTVGSKVMCRIIGYNYLDGLVLASMKSSVISQKFLTYSDIKVGMKIEAKIKAFYKSGLNVEVSDRIQGFIPRLHIDDVPLTNPLKKYKEGDKLLCRVLEVTPAASHLVLTHKKTIINSDLPVLKSYEDAKVNDDVHGTVANVKDFGVFVSFYNKVRGLIPKQFLSDQPIQSPDKLFYKGQVLKCRIRSCKPEEERLGLTLKTASHMNIVVDVPDDFKVGKLTDVMVTNLMPNGLQVAILPSRIPALLPKMHLSDSVENCDVLFNCYQPDDVISDVMYLSKQPTLTVTMKTSLIQAVKDNQCVTNFSDLYVDLVLNGFIKQIMPYGVFVGFPNNITGLAPKLYMGDIFVDDAGVPYKNGQSVKAKVLEINTEKKRFIVSLRPSHCYKHTDGGVTLLEEYLQERKKACKLLKEIADKKNICQLSIGDVVKATVNDVQGKGVLLSLENGLTAVASTQSTHGVSCEEGMKVEVCVLYLDYANNVAAVTMKPCIVQFAMKKTKQKKVAEIQNGEAVVELVKSDIVVVSLSDGRLALLPGKKHLNDGVRMRSAFLQEGQEIDIVPKKFVRNSLVVVQNMSKMSLSAGNMKEERIKENKEKTRHHHFRNLGEKLGIELGTKVTAVVKSVRDTFMHVTVKENIQGRVHVSEIMDKPTNGQFPLKLYKQGMEVTGTVIGYRDIKFNKFLPISHHNLKEFGLEISLKKSYLQENTGTESANQEFEYTKNFDSLLDRFKEGQSIYCYVEKYENKFLRVDITPRMRGVVYFLHLSKNCHDLYSPEKHFKPGQAHKALVMKIDKQHKKLDLSLDGTVSNDLKEGAVQNGWITHKYPTELGVQLAGGNHGNVFITDINDKYSDDPIKMFRINQFVRCCILDCKDEKHVTLSLRQSRINHNIVSVPDKEIRNLCDLSVGDIVKGYVKDYSEVGVFVSLSKELKGRIQLKNLSSYYVNKSAEAFYCGKLVTAKVLSIDVDNSKIELSIHPEHTGLPDQLEKRYRGSLKCVGDSERRKYVEQRKKQKRKRQDSEESDSGIDGVLKDADSDSEVEIITSKMSNTSKVARLELAGFSWDDKTFTANLTQSAKEMSGDSDSEDDDTNEEPLKKKTKKERQQEEKEEEKFLYRTELSLMDQDRAPENVDDFDRLVLSSPDSSMIWIRYMAFYLHTTDIDKARAVAERALKTISFREEQEKLNVWVAYLNLENLYGTNETLVKLFERALQMCDPLKVFRSMINIYTKTQKLEEAEQLYSTMVRRFNFHKDVWASYGMFLMKSGKLDAARKIMQRSFKSLDKSDHVEIIVKFAQFEFKFGEPERGRTMFENVLSNYPKRTDIWSIYIDMVIKQGHIDAIRQLFERVIHLNLSPKRMKFFFKRYLEFEKKYGEESTVENVKQKAMHYVESKVSISESS